MARTRTKLGATRTARRREELRRALPKPAPDLRALLRQPQVIYAIGVSILFMVVIAGLVNWSREQIKVEPGRVMTDTRLKRLDYRVPDIDSTETLRESARQSAPHVYTLNSAYLERIAGALNGLPTAVGGKTSIEEISEDLVTGFDLTDRALAELAPYVHEGETSREWRQWVTTLVELLETNPIIKSDAFQTSWALRAYTPLKRLLHRPEGGMEEFPDNASAVELREESLEGVVTRLRELVMRSNFPPAVAPYVTAKLAADPQPTILFDSEASARQADQAGNAIETVYIEHSTGEVIYSRGDMLTSRQRQEIVTEAEAFRTDASISGHWMPRVGVLLRPG